MSDARPSDITFVVVGCQRCGTTWTDAALREHPQVFLPALKQTYFFDRNFERGMEWYLQRFDGIEANHDAVGEVATGYCLPQAVPLMASNLPDVKVIMIMRHPVDRAYSNFQSRCAEEGWSSFTEALDADEDLLARGRYIEQIDLLMEHYGRDRFLAVLYDDLNGDDRGFLKSILSFIDVDCGFESGLFGQRKNAAMFPRARKAMHAVGLEPLLKAASKSPVGDVIRRGRKQRGRAYQAMDAETRSRLLDHFRPLNDRLAEFLGRDLSAWDR